MTDALSPDLAGLLQQSQTGATPTQAVPAQSGNALSPDLAGILAQAHAPASSTTPASATQPYTGGILPISVDAQGNTHFDPHAGILGSIISAVTAPGDVYAGKLDPTSPEGERQAFNLATLISPVNPAVRAGDYAIPGALKNLQIKVPKAPTAEALKNAADAGYTGARATGATYPGEAVGAAAQQAISGLQNDGILPELAPQTHSILGKLANPPDGPVATIGSLDAARKALNRIGGNFQNPTEQEAARRAIKTVDQIIQNGATPPPVAGTSPAAAAGAANGSGTGGVAALPNTTGAYTTPEAAAANLIRDARGNAAAAFRSNRLTGAEDAAELRAAATNSGQNIGNALRQRLASLLLNPKAARGYSQDELDAIRQVVQGTPSTNAMRRVGNMFGGGGGIGHTIIGALGALGGGYLGGIEGAGIGAAALPTLGAVTRHAYNSAVQRGVENAAQLVRMRSPLYQQMLNNAPRVPGSYALPSRLMRGGLLGQMQPPDGSTSP